MTAFTFKWFGALLFLGGLLGAPGVAQADNINPPPYVGAPCSTHGEFLLTDGNVTSSVNVFGSCAFPLAFEGPTTATDTSGSDSWLFDVIWPNFVDPLPIKYLRIQLTFIDNGTPGGSFNLGVTATDPITPTVDLVADSGLCFTCTQDGTAYAYRDYVIRPNPDFEEFILTYNPQDLVLSQFVVDTVSTPEPGMLAVLGFGLAAIGLARRRRAAP